MDNKASETTHSLFSVRKKDVYVNTKISGKSVVEKVFSAEKKFSDLEIHRHVVANLVKNGFTSLTKVQEKSIPEVVAGKNVLVSKIVNWFPSVCLSAVCLNFYSRFFY